MLPLSPSPTLLSTLLPANSRTTRAFGPQLAAERCRVVCLGCKSRDLSVAKSHRPSGAFCGEGESNTLSQALCGSAVFPPVSALLSSAPLERHSRAISVGSPLLCSCGFFSLQTRADVRDATAVLEVFAVSFWIGLAG
ncbi:hypothetical protein SRHO_G00085740 [Serrasalmus rhombeus]